MTARPARSDIRRCGIRRWLAGATLLVTLALLSGCQPPRPAAEPARDTASETRRTPPRRASELARARQPVEARLQHVQDGDSFVVITAPGERLTVRLAGIDAPERQQPFADVSRRHLRSLLEHRPLTVLPVKTDRYGRLVAHVLATPARGASVDAGFAQIEAGLAWFFERFERDLTAPERQRYREAADTARRARRGLWQQPAPEAPWDFRARHR